MTEIQSNKIILFKVTSKIKYLGISLTKEVKDYKTLIIIKYL